ncbi:hypothetical protein PAPYR_10344 [Paratrimastix pyriformis]|uniref:Uncharacterized protein n=1 Tax=Paratrimastix pyriformis TaxID=342808 RepID=A0ABQ8UBU0_9EUKA|nr:hypothetical protein PAPYR_10344 [Paratrimastix pyriformis]
MMFLLVFMVLLLNGLALDCPVRNFHPASFHEALIDGDELVVTVNGYSLSSFVIASGPPPAMGEAACRPTATVFTPNPAVPCDVVTSFRALLTDLRLCSAVSTEPVGDKLLWRLPLHVLSTVLTGHDPSGSPVYGRRYQSMRILIEQTVSANASTTVDLAHAVNYTGFEKGDSFFDHIGSRYVMHFSVWTNFPYEQGPPFVTSAPVPLGDIDLISEPADDNCGNSTTFCERAYYMVIYNQSTTCLLGGSYRIGSHVTCREAEHCPSGTEGDYFAEYVIVPGDCGATVINITVSGRLWVEMDGGTALAWGRPCTVMGQLASDVPLASADMLQLRVCTLPHIPCTAAHITHSHAPLTHHTATSPSQSTRTRASAHQLGEACPESASQLLVHDNVPASWGSLPELQLAVGRPAPALWNVTLRLDLAAFRYALGVDPDPNRITELQFDAQFGNFVAGHVTTSLSFSLRAAASDRDEESEEENMGNLVKDPTSDFAFVVPVTGLAVDSVLAATGTIAIAAGGATGTLVLLAALFTGLLVVRRRHLTAHNKAVTPAPTAPTPVTVAPTPVTVAPTPVTVAPTPVAVAPTPVTVAPTPVIVAPTPAQLPPPLVR